MTLREAIAVAARLGGRSTPGLALPSGLLAAIAPLGRLVGQPNLREIVRASGGVTYLASPARAEAELGFSARSIEDGLRDTFGAA